MVARAGSNGHKSLMTPSSGLTPAEMPAGHTPGDSRPPATDPQGHWVEGRRRKAVVNHPYYSVDLSIITRNIPRMKTTLDLPPDLLDEAVRISGGRTKREAVIRALEEFTRRAKLAQLADRLGDSETFMSFDELMERRENEKP